MTEQKRSNWEKKYHFLQLVYQIQQDLISFADTKAAGVMTLNFAILAFVASRVKSIKSELFFISDGGLFVFILLAMLYFFVFLRSMREAILTLSPKLGKGPMPHYGQEFLFAFHVLEHENSRTYARELMESRGNKILEDYSFQIYGVSEILMGKFMSVQKSLFYLEYNFLFAFLLIILLELIF